MTEAEATSITYSSLRHVINSQQPETLTYIAFIGAPQHKKVNSHELWVWMFPIQHVHFILVRIWNYSNGVYAEWDYDLKNHAAQTACEKDNPVSATHSEGIISAIYLFWKEKHQFWNLRPYQKRDLPGSAWCPRSRQPGKPALDFYSVKQQTQLLLTAVLSVGTDTQERGSPHSLSKSLFQ